MLIGLTVMKPCRIAVDGIKRRGFSSVATAGDFEKRLVSLAGQEAVKCAKALLKAKVLLGAWRDHRGGVNGEFAAENGGRIRVHVDTGEETRAECGECGAGVCAHAVALIMHAGRFPLREKTESQPSYYGGLRSETMAALIERGKRSGAELSIQAQSSAPHVPSKWESMTLRVQLRDSGRECSGNLNNLRKLYFDKTLNVVIRYDNFSLQEQQIIRFLALYGEPDGSGIALDSELTAELFHSLVDFPRFFRDGRALCIRGERAEPALLDTGRKLVPGLLIGGAPLPVSGARVGAGRSGCWVGCGQEYFFDSRKCEIGFLRSFFRSEALERSALKREEVILRGFQLPVVKSNGRIAPERGGRVLCDCAVESEAGKLVLRRSFIYPGRGIQEEFDPGSGVLECSGGKLWKRDSAMERRFDQALALFGFNVSSSVAELNGTEQIALFFDSALPELRRGFDLVSGSGLSDYLSGVPAVEISCSHLETGTEGHLLSCRITAAGKELPWESVSTAAAERRRAFLCRDGIFRLGDETARWIRGATRVLRHSSGTEFLLAFRDTAYFNTLSVAVPGARLPELYRERDPQTPPARPEFEFTGELRPYQREGVAFLQFLSDRGFGALLADEMGLGKTVQLLAFLASRLRADDDPALVVCPASLVTNWEREAERFIPGLQVGVLHGSGRRELAGMLDRCDLAILSYAAARLNCDTLKKRRLSYLILDEAQHIKNPGSGNARSCKNLTASHRIVLSGTPLENSPEDLWSIMDFLQPGMLGTQAEFRRAYGGAEDDPELKQDLAARTAPFIKRRTKQRVAPDLPTRSELTLYCELPPEQRELYNRTLEEGRRMLGERGAESNGAAIFSILLRLRQICCHPALLPGGAGKGLPSAKTELLMELLHENIDSSHKLLLFSQFTSLLRLLIPGLESAGILYEYLDGSTRDRQRHVDNFNRDDSIPLFLLSLKAGGTGLNLTAADTVIIYDPWWNPAVETQAADRTHRIGQTRPVSILKLVVKDSIEEKILLLQERKPRVFDAVGADPGSSGCLTLEELQLLLG